MHFMGMESVATNTCALEIKMTVQHWVGLDENEAHEGSNMEVDCHSEVTMDLEWLHCLTTLLIKFEACNSYDMVSKLKL